ncbi:hypothetical protein [Salmonella phage SSBI34]|nr:hypothetical protein [Salmonella phage SSBI34]
MTYCYICEEDTESFTYTKQSVGMYGSITLCAEVCEICWTTRGDFVTIDNSGNIPPKGDTNDCN